MRYVYLDGLRGLAILGVMATHIGQVVGGVPDSLAHNMVWGIRGVHLFFIVSSLTLFLVTKPDNLVTTDFLLRRFFRIAPMFYLAAFFYTYAAHMGWLVPRGGPPSSVDVGMTLLFLHGFNLHGINNVVPGGWSIACEAIFYIMFVVFITRVQTIPKALVCVAISLVLVITSYVLTKIFRNPSSDTNVLDFYHFNFFFNSLPFALGAAVFNIVKRHHQNLKLRDIAKFGQWIVGLVILIYGALMPAYMVYEIPFSLFLASYALFVAIAPPRFIVSRPLQFIGEISFSLYLVHFAVIIAIEHAYLRSPNGYLGLAIIVGLTFLGSVAIATPLHWLIERPMISVGRRLTAKSKDLQLANAHEIGKRS